MKHTKHAKEKRDETPRAYEPSEVSENEAEGEETNTEKEKTARELKKEQRLKEKNAKKLEKLMKKQHSKKPELTEADEEEPDEEEGEPRRARRKKSSRFTKKHIILAVLILVVLFVVMLFAFGGDRFSMHNISNFINYGIFNRNSEEKFPLDIKGENVSAGSFVRKGQDVCYCSDTRTQLLNNYGRSVYSVQHAFIRPAMASSNEKTLVYNLGGTAYQIIGKDGKFQAFEAEDNIICAAINNKGVYALVTQNGGYLSKLYVYDDEQNQIYAYSFADYYVTSVDLSDSGKQAVVSGISALDGVSIASVYVLDFTKDSPRYFSEYQGDLIYEVRYLSGDRACAIGSTAAYSVNTSNGSVETYAYEGRALTAYDINTDTSTYTLALSSSGDGRNCDIVSFNSSGKAEKSFNIDERIIGLSTYKGRVMLLSSDSVMLYSKDGTHYNDKALSSDPHAVVMYTASDAYVLCTGYIDTVTL